MVLLSIRENFGVLINQINSYSKSNRLWIGGGKLVAIFAHFAVMVFGKKNTITCLLLSIRALIKYPSKIIFIRLFQKIILNPWDMIIYNF
jgi:hypothetical protein